MRRPVPLRRVAVSEPLLPCVPAAVLEQVHEAVAADTDVEVQGYAAVQASVLPVPERVAGLTDRHAFAVGAGTVVGGGRQRHRSDHSSSHERDSGQATGGYESGDGHRFSLQGVGTTSRGRRP